MANFVNAKETAESLRTNVDDIYKMIREAQCRGEDFVDIGIARFSLAAARRMASGINVRAEDLEDDREVVAEIRRRKNLR